MDTCPRCALEIETTWRRCRYCGEPLARGWRASVATLSCAVILLLFAAAAIWWSWSEVGQVRALLLGVSILALAVAIVGRSADGLLHLTLVIVLGGFVGLGVLTRYPEARWLVAAEAWPVVGPAASWFRQSFGAAQAEGISGVDEEPAEVVHLAPVPEASASRRSVGRPNPPRGATPPPSRQPPAAIPERLDRLPELPTTEWRARVVRPAAPAMPEAMRPAPTSLPVVEPGEVEDWLWTLPGSELSEAVEGPATIRVSALSLLPILERREGWSEVVYRGERAWLNTEREPPHPTKGAKPRRFNPPRPNDVTLLKRARKIMQIEKADAMVGPYRLHTDLEDEALLAFLDSAVQRAEEAYFARYGRLPAGKPRRSMVLFAREEQYREYSAKRKQLPGMSHVGHAGSGIVVLFAEGRGREELAATLLHESAHLLNTRALAPVLPPWLEEGLASDLGRLWIEEIQPPGRRRRVEIRGSEAQTLYVAEMLEQGVLPPTLELLTLPREVFYRDSVGRMVYAHSGLLVTYLIEGEAGRWADGFRSFLERIAVGHPPKTEMLFEQLAATPSRIDEGFREWVNAEVETVEKRHGIVLGALRRER